MIQIRIDPREEWLLLPKKRVDSFQTISNDSKHEKYSQIFENLQFEQRINIERRPNRREKRVDEQVKRGGIAILEPPPQVVAGP